MNLELKEDFFIEEEGTHYQLPCYKVVDGGGIQRTANTVDLKFVRGSKLKDEEVEKREGTLHDHVLAAMINDLRYKNSLVPCRETSLAITDLQSALNWIRQRQVDRITRGVRSTYKK